MQVKTKIALSMFVLLFFSAQSVPAFDDAVGCYYSDELKAGDEFTWATTFYGSGMFDSEFVPIGITNNSIIKLEILQDPKDINFHWDSMPFYESQNYFNLTLGDVIYDFEWDDIFYLWISWTNMDFENGTSRNPTEKEWIYFVSDDFYFLSEDTEVVIDIEISNKVVTYDAYVNYTTEGVVSYVYGEIDQINGVMIQLEFTSDDNGVINTVNFMRQNYTPRQVSWYFPLSICLLLIVPIILTRRRK
ncbi:MAG: hypothetical protein KGD64_06070 [Candidatus Heimdallarchaeota archaeon]|nr:hypothetical protein [Candidatus Heimdallarchaeota archaeon]